MYGSLRKYSLVLVISMTSAQNIHQQLYKDSISKVDLVNLNSEFGKNKTFDTIYEKHILTALSYFPELVNVRIKFRLTKTNTPLSSRPTFWSLFRASQNRNYNIIISTKTKQYLEPILFEKLSYNAQIGVLGHEISHISDYITKDFFGLISLLWIEIFTKKQVDAFEKTIDEICLNHGLGFQLLAWSKSVRKNLKIENWRGANNIDLNQKIERYLNPSSIIEKINQNSIYNIKKNM